MGGEGELSNKNVKDLIDSLMENDLTLDELKKFEPDDDTALFSLCGPPTLKVTMDKDESGANRLFCKIENGEGEINLNQLTHKERYPQQVQMNLI